MAGPEAQQKAPEQPKDIPGFKGLERMEKIDALKKGGAFREFLDKVVSIRSNPEQQKKVAEALQKIDSDTSLSDDQKKEQLRLQPQADLLAIIGKNIEFGEKGMNVTLDFGKLAFAEQKGIGAGHLFPPNVTNVSFGGENKGTEAKRSPGTRGGEYRSKKNKYMSSFTGTKLFIAYKDIMPFDAKQMESAIKLEKDSMQKVQATVGEAHSAQAGLRGSEKLTPPAVAAPLAAEQTPAQAARVEPPLVQGRESNERFISRSPVFIGDSQVQGLKGSLAKRGIRSFDYVGKTMQSIAAHIRALPEQDRQAIKKADTIVFQCGGNNLAGKEGYPLKKMQDNFYLMISAIKSINPDAKIKVGTLMAPGKYSSNKPTRAAYNAWLKEEAAKTGNFSVMDTYAMTEDPNNPGHRIEQLFGGANNPHLKWKEYFKLSPKMLEAINYQPA